MAPEQNLPDDEMERKFQELRFDELLKGCETRRISRDSYIHPVYSKREHAIEYSKNGKVVAIIFFWNGPDGEERSIRRLVDGDTIYESS